MADDFSRTPMTYRIRPVQQADAAAWPAMRGALWPDADVAALHDETERFLAGTAVPHVSAAFIADCGRPVGFLELSIRAFANGCDSMPVPFVEGWYVEASSRGKGIGRALMLAAEGWACERGFAEIGSDAELENQGSLSAHESCGFSETERVVYFKKRL